jgi:hypothetical protein
VEECWILWCQLSLFDIDTVLILWRLVEVIYLSSMDVTADTYGRAAKDVGVLPLACWYIGFESRRRHGCISRMLRVVRYRYMRRADRSSREVLPKPQWWGDHCPLGLFSQKKNVVDDWIWCEFIFFQTTQKKSDSLYFDWRGRIFRLLDKSLHVSVLLLQ